MAATDSQPSSNESWKKRETLSSALVQIGAVALILALAVFLVYRRGTTKKEISELMAEARSTALRGNPADLKKALKVVDQALEKDSAAADAFALAGTIYTDLWLIHREPGAEQKAKEFLDKAKRGDSKGEDRYGTEAMHLIAAGNPHGAETFIEELRKRGASSAKLFYAQALALKQQGNLLLARQAYTSAMDKSWKDPQYAAAWGEAILEEGLPGAGDVFNKSLGANPDYFRARLGLALSRVQRKDRIGEAEAGVKDVLARDAELSPPLKARALAIQAGIANIQAQPDQAIALADQATSLNPDDVWALFAKANALVAKKDPGAGAAYDAAIARAKWAPVFYFEGATRLQQAGMSEQAVALLDKYESFFKGVKNQTADGKEFAWIDRDDRYWLARGDLAREAGKIDEALGHYDKAIAAKNLNIVKATYAKASIYVMKKEWDTAGTLLFDITPQDGTGQLAEAYAAMGEVLFAKKEWGAGCQNYAFALTRMKATQTPREQLNLVLTDVEKKLKTGGQAPIAKIWMTEAKPLIQ